MTHRLFLIVLVVLSIGPGIVHARMVALVIGNSAYQNVATLDNPRRDAEMISRSLTALGYEVVNHFDLDRAGMLDALGRFRQQADEASIALVYYAGHGIEIGGINYLVPVDAKLLDERDAAVELVRLDSVLSQTSGASRMKMVVLDACRNNPFAQKMQRENRGRNVGRGLAKIEATHADTLVAYAAAPGEITPDGAPGGNSPFTAAFASALDGPAMDVRRMMGVVHDTMRLTVPEAAPAIYAALGGDEYVINVKTDADVTEFETAAETSRQMRDAFDQADATASIEGWTAFLTRYAARRGDSLYELALTRRDRLLTSTDRAGTAGLGPAARSKNEIIRDIQLLLKERRCYQSSVDGIFGQGSLRAIDRLAAASGIRFAVTSTSGEAELEAALAQMRDISSAACPQVRKKTTVVANPRPGPSPSAGAGGASQPPARPAIQEPATNCVSFEGRKSCS